jgi:hypothetical protein
VRPLGVGSGLEPDKFRSLCVNANVTIDEDNEPIGFLEEEPVDHIQGTRTNCRHTRPIV